jgi:hypothetical protein
MLPAPFVYPETPHVRRHGPRGYGGHRGYQRFKPWLRDDFAFRCIYCLFRERWYPSGQDAFSVEHVLPQQQAPDRINDYCNLAYACLRCNSLKLLSLLLDPCTSAYGSHLRIWDDGTIEGLTADGARIIEILRLDDEQLNVWRRRMLEVIRRIERTMEPAWWRRVLDWLRRPRGIAELPSTVPPDAMAELVAWFGFPDDLPDLAALRPPGDNARPDGLAESHFALHQQGRLPPLY